MPRTARRSYDSTRRARQAAQTRADVLEAATELFGERGWTGTTLAAVAARAGVSVETIYKGFGSKKALLREAMDMAVAGDAAPVAYIDREGFASLGEGTLAERSARGAAIVATINERSAGVWQAIVEAAASDEEVERWRRELEDSRRLDTRRSIERVLDGAEVDEHLVTLLWVLYSPETYRKLVVDRGLSRAEYESLLVDASQRLFPR
jgi:AcrR family transcriptional regulator